MLHISQGAHEIAGKRISPYIHDIFRTMNLTRVLDIVESRNDALAKLKL